MYSLRRTYQLCYVILTFNRVAYLSFSSGAAFSAHLLLNNRLLALSSIKSCYMTCSLIYRIIFDTYLNNIQEVSFRNICKIMKNKDKQG